MKPMARRADRMFSARPGIPVLTRVAAAVLLLVAGGGCSRCGGSGAPVATTAADGGSLSPVVTTAGDKEPSTPVPTAPPARPRADADAGDPRCFSVGYGQNSAGTAALFAHRDLQ